MNIKPPTTQCQSCPFRDDGIKLRPAYLGQIYGYLLKGENHLCHAVRDDKRVCFGGRQWQLEMFYRLGIIRNPTNEALAEAMRESGVEPKECIGDRHELVPD